MKKLIPILLAVFALASCEKDPDMGKLDDNYLVYTNYDKKADFMVLCGHRRSCRRGGQDLQRPQQHRHRFYRAADPHRL